MMMGIPRHSCTGHVGKNSLWDVFAFVFVFVFVLPRHSCTGHVGKNIVLEEQTQAHRPTDDLAQVAKPFLIQYYDYFSNDHMMIA